MGLTFVFLYDILSITINQVAKKESNMSRLYHKKVFWCASFDSQAKALFNKNYSLHLFEHLLYSTDKHGMTMRELDRIIDELIDNKRCYFLYEVETQAKDEITKVFSDILKAHNYIFPISARSRSGAEISDYLEDSFKAKQKEGCLR